MVRVNKTHRVEKFREEAWRRFLDKIKRTSSTDALMKELRNTLTTSEIVMIEKRLIIQTLMEKGMGSREIGKLIDVSPTTVHFIKGSFIKKPVTHRRYSSPSRKNAPKYHHSSKGIGTLIWKT